MHWRGAIDELAPSTRPASTTTKCIGAITRRLTGVVR
jgi:hypothetical protein